MNTFIKRIAEMLKCFKAFRKDINMMSDLMEDHYHITQVQERVIQGFDY